MAVTMRGLFGGSTPAAIAAPAPAAPAAAPAGGSNPGADRPITAPISREFPRSDPIHRLPEPAKAKLARLRQAADEAGIVASELSRRRHNAANEKIDAERYRDAVRASRATGRPRSGSTVSTFMRGGEPSEPFSMEMRSPGRADERQLADAERRYADAKAELDDLNRRIDEATARRSRVPDRIKRWLEDLPANVKIELHNGKAGGKSTKPATPEAVAELRERRLQLAAKISATMALPPPIGTVIDRMRAQIDALAGSGRPDYLQAVERGGAVKFREKQVQSQVVSAAGVAVSINSQPDLLALFAYVHRDALIAKLGADLTEMGDSGGMSDEEKARIVQQLRAETLECERQEEIVIQQLEASGAAVSRREDADPRAILGLSSDLPAFTSITY